MRILHFNGESDLEVFPDTQEEADLFIYAGAAHQHKTPAQSELLSNIARAVNATKHASDNLPQLERAMLDAQINTAKHETPITEQGFKSDEAAFIFETMHELAAYKGSHHSARSHAARLVLQNAYETPAILPQPQMPADTHQGGYIQV